MSIRNTKKSWKVLFLKYLIVTMMSEVLAKKLPPGSVNQTVESLINPGTKWCGRGNVATNYQDLGPMENVDKCCRDHDHCLLYIHGRTWKYGLYNDEFYTSSECRCDMEFHACLKSVTGFESIAAAQVGMFYFTLLKPRCFFAMTRVPCENPYYDQFNVSYKHDGAGEYFCARWYENVNWE